MLEFRPEIPSPYSEVMRESEKKLRFEAEILASRSGQGDMFNVVRAEADNIEANRLLNVLQSTLNVDDSNVQHIDVGAVIGAMQLRIGREGFGIPDDGRNYAAGGGSANRRSERKVARSSSRRNKNGFDPA